VYLPPFEATVREADAWTVMAAYNRLDGVHCTEHETLLETILRTEWGFDGVVISDWFATQTTAPSARAGMDLEMPGPPRRYGAKLAAAVRAGELPESALDACVHRILRLLDRTGVLDEAPREGGAPEQAIDRPEHRALAREVAADAITLLRNENKALPLDAKLRTLAVIGPAADRAVIQGGGSARVTPHYAVRPLDGLRARAERAGVTVHFERGCANERGVAPLDDRLARTPDGEPGLRVECFSNTDASGTPALSLRAASAELLWLSTPAQLPAGQPWSARVRAQIVAPASGVHTFSLTSAGKTRLRIDGREIVDNWTKWERGSAFFGLGSREATGEIALLEGATCELEVEFLHDAPVPLAGMRIGYRPPEVPDAMERAVAAAAKADAAVVVVGLDPDWETEGRDRESFALPGRQNELVARVAAANPRTIVVVNAGSPVAMDWAEQAAAIALLWYPGQESGNALADVLFGDVDPGGRLPLTIPVRMEDTPAFLDVPGENLRIAYGEGLFVGHRWYDARDIAPRFAFGHGLSFAEFRYGDVRVASPRVAEGDDVACEIEVANVSERAGVEVVQLYLQRISSGVRRPLRTLAAFEKIALAPGERRVVRFAIPSRAFAYWDVAQNDWHVEAGEWEIAAGRSSRDQRGAAPVVIE
jgi:beta-glucosidase